ncbi:hypothetical protein ACROYT_G008733 [Oculina patagonica]
MDQLTSLKSEVNKLKDEVVAMDQGLFDKSGRRLSPGKSIHHDFNSATIYKLNELDQNVSAFVAQVDEKLNELQSTFKGFVYKPTISKARKRKQNKRRALVSLSGREAKVLHETVKSDSRFSEAGEAYISDSLPPSFASSDSESLSDSDDSDQ